MKETTTKGNPLSRGERLQIMLDDSELQAVDDFRFGHRMASRAAAVRELLRRGLAAGGAIGQRVAGSRASPATERQPFGGNGSSGD